MFSYARCGIPTTDSHGSPPGTVARLWGTRLFAFPRTLRETRGESGPFRGRHAFGSVTIPKLKARYECRSGTRGLILQTIVCIERATGNVITHVATQSGNAPEALAACPAAEIALLNPQ